MTTTERSYASQRQCSVMHKRPAWDKLLTHFPTRDTGMHIIQVEDRHKGEYDLHWVMGVVLNITAPRRSLLQMCLMDTVVVMWKTPAS